VRAGKDIFIAQARDLWPRAVRLAGEIVPAGPRLASGAPLMAAADRVVRAVVP